MLFTYLVSLHYVDDLAVHPYTTWMTLQYMDVLTYLVSLHYVDVLAVNGCPCSTWMSLHYMDDLAVHAYTTWMTLQYMLTLRG